MEETLRLAAMDDRPESRLRSATDGAVDEGGGEGQHHDADGEVEDAPGHRAGEERRQRARPEAQ